ncbi:hypothetical protein [Archangium violaceum]|uniref:hypothetical protein n=1 Tax=Archangium violaceum TaxID=83451 RepID=UPI0036DD43B7
MPNAITRSLQLAAVRKDAAALTAVEAGSGQRVYTFKASDSDFDRYSDRLSVKGWRVDAYNANGVVLINHDDGTLAARTGAEPALPIGKGRVYVEGDALMIDIVFDDEDDFARKVERKVSKGILNAVSVRYLMLPGQYRQNERGGLAVPVMVAERRGQCAACALVIEQGEVITYERAVGALHMACSDRPAERRRNLYPARCELCGTRLGRGQGPLSCDEREELSGWRRRWVVRCTDAVRCKSQSFVSTRKG